MSGLEVSIVYLFMATLLLIECESYKLPNHQGIVDIPRINHAIISNHSVVDLDLKLPPGSDKSQYFLPDTNTQRTEVRLAAAAASSNILVWQLPVPYVIDASVDDTTRRLIEEAIKRFGEKTCVSFKEKQLTDSDYIQFSGDGTGCWSFVGRIGGMQKVNLQRSGCNSIVTVLHEIMHALGFWHEQSRPDRDNYVTIHYSNIQPQSIRNFEKRRQNEVNSMDSPYDYKSVMHYRSWYFSKNGKNTISRKDGKPPNFNNDYGLTLHDIAQIKGLYRCDGKGEWTSWSDEVCSVTCGTGTVLRKRDCNQVQSSPSRYVVRATCRGPSIRYEDCFCKPCPRVVRVHNCFPGDAFVRNEKGFKIAMEDLKVGEKVLTTDDNGGVALSEITMFLHRNTNTTSGHHLKLSTENDKSITLTPLHLIQVATTKEYAFAKEVRVGEQIIVYDPWKNLLQKTTVVRIEEIRKRGMYAPLTATGTLLVDDVHVSCYASFRSHSVSQAVMWIWRKLSAHVKWLQSERTDDSGIHWFPSCLLSFATALSIV